MQIRIEMVGPLVVNKKFGKDYIIDLTNHSDFIFSYLKPYYKLGSKDYCYYDEREWRYVPTPVSENTKMMYNFKLDKKECERINQEYEKYSLKFTPKDIAYIVIKSDDERKEIIQKIFEIKSPKYSRKEEDIEVLVSKIISAEQIIQDM